MACQLHHELLMDALAIRILIQGAGARVVSCILGPMARLGAGASLERMMMVGGEIVPLDPRGRGAAA